MALQFNSPADPVFTSDAEIAAINTDPGFGTHFTDHMAVARWDLSRGWHDDAIVPYAPLDISPAGAVFHYAQEVFEGLKAYRRSDGSIWLFRPEANGKRMVESARRLALPQLSVEDFLTSLHQLTALDARWVPGAEEQSLYLRPFEVASEDFVGVRAARSVVYCLIASPVGAYFSDGVAPVDIWVDTVYSRAGAGGTGAVKCGGNYAGSLLAQELATEQGCSQVLFTDAASHTWVEELGGMNFFVVTASGELVTPALSGTILPGITRDSILKVAPLLGLTPVERPLAVAEVKAGITDGTIREVFACGTAAVITPIGSLRDESGVWAIDTPVEGSTTIELRDYLLDIQYGRRPDDFGWTQRVC